MPNTAVPAAAEGLPTNTLSIHHGDGFVSLSLRHNDRVSLAMSIEALIDMLDALDTDADLEDGGDNEPWLGFSKIGGGAHQGDCGDDREQDDELEDDGCAEPWLGWTTDGGLLGDADLELDLGTTDEIDQEQQA